MDKKLISLVIPTRNASAQTRSTIAKHIVCADGAGLSLEVVVVDDGSARSELESLQEISDPRVKVIVNDTNLGRGGAINAGVCATTGELLLIVDCDCPPANHEFLSEHMRSLDAGTNVSIGALLSRGSDFWSRYQDQAVIRRERQFAEGTMYAFTSQNVLMDSAWFHAIGGFNQSYRRYGFEDRDFFIRLAAAGAKIGYTPLAGVIHEDENIKLETIIPKMMDAGEFTALRFTCDHPEAYRKLGYAAIDARMRPWLGLLGRMFGRPTLKMSRGIDPLLNRLPFSIAKAIVKVITALAFICGTAHSSSLRLLQSGAR